ncbi:F0F1 ATP synthase subunit B family protein [Streptomyces sp. NPDC055078]
MNENLLPFDIGPLNPSGYGLIAGFLSFALGYAALAWLVLPRAARVIKRRDELTHGVLRHAETVRAEAEAVRTERDAILAGARHDAARTRHRAKETGTRLIGDARADGQRERERIVAAGTAAIAAERALAETALRAEVDTWGRALAERILGEPLSAPVRTDGPRATDG